jgi:hypothetical protein
VDVVLRSDDVVAAAVGRLHHLFVAGLARTPGPYDDEMRA